MLVAARFGCSAVTRLREFAEHAVISDLVLTLKIGP